jgi:hypothetical protein
MRAILLIVILSVFIAGPVWAENFDKTHAYAVCSQYIENQVSQFRRNPIPPGHKIEAPARVPLSRFR